MSDKQVRFIRKNGRIIPIRMSTQEKVGRISAATAITAGASLSYYNLGMKAVSTSSAVKSFRNAVHAKQAMKVFPKQISYLAQKFMNERGAAKFHAAEQLRYGNNFKKSMALLGAGILGSAYYLRKQAKTDKQKKDANIRIGSAVGMLGAFALANRNIDKAVSKFTG